MQSIIIDIGKYILNKNIRWHTTDKVNMTEFYITHEWILKIKPAKPLNVEKEINSSTMICKK